MHFWWSTPCLHHPTSSLHLHLQLPLFSCRPLAGRVKCWAFEPPGGMMTRVVSRALQPLCTSTALGKDWIPRLSVSSFERMRDDMVRVRSSGFTGSPASPSAPSIKRMRKKHGPKF
jgi:hypothetical protein